MALTRVESIILVELPQEEVRMEMEEGTNGEVEMEEEPITLVELTQEQVGMKMEVQMETEEEILMED